MDGAAIYLRDVENGLLLLLIGPSFHEERTPFALSPILGEISQVAQYNNNQQTSFK